MRLNRYWIFLIGIMLIGTAGFWSIRRVRAQDEREARLEGNVATVRDEATKVEASAAADPPATKSTTKERPKFQDDEVERLDASKTEAESAVVKVVLVFFQDISRRAIEGVMFDTGKETWVVVASTATTAPNDTPNAVDRVYVEGAGPAAIDAEYVYSLPGLNFYRLPGRVSKYQLTEAPGTQSKRAVGDEVVAIRTQNINGHFIREPMTIAVTYLNDTYHYKPEGVDQPSKFTNLFHVSVGLPEGTPVFQNGQLAGITLIGTRLYGGKPGTPKASLVIPIERLREDCRRAIAFQAAEESLRTSVPNLTPHNSGYIRVLKDLPSESPALDSAAEPSPATADAQTTLSSDMPKTAISVQSESAAPPFRFFAVEPLDAESTATTLRSLFSDRNDGQGIIRIAANASTKTIIVSAPDAEVAQIEATLNHLKKRFAERMQENEKSAHIVVPALGPLPLATDFAFPVARNSTAQFSVGFLDQMTGLKDSEKAAQELDAKYAQETQQLAENVRTAKGEARDKLRSELETLTERYFDQRQQRRKHEIDELADRVDRLRVTHARRNEQRSEIIKRRVAELLNENRDLNWDEANNTQPEKGATPEITKEDSNAQKPPPADTPESSAPVVNETGIHKF